MPALLSTKGIARASARHPWRVLGLWVVLLAVAGFLASGLGNALSTNADFTNQPESKRGRELIKQHMGEEPLTETIIVQSDGRTVDDPAFQAVVQKTAADARAMTGFVATATSYYDALAAGGATADSMVSADRHTALVSVELAATASTFDDISDRASDYVNTVDANRVDGFKVYTVGDASGNEVYGKISNEDMAKSEVVGVPVAILVLVVVFGALVAAGLPILLGIVSIFVATGLTAVLARVIQVNGTVLQMISMIGLAVGIDYALFLIERYREERRHGYEKIDAIGIAGSTAGKAVLFSGMTVMLALLGMFIIPISIFHSLAVGAILAVIVAVLATQTLIPALLGLLGDTINWPRRRAFTKRAERSSQTVIHGGFWGRMTTGVMAHPLVTLVVALAILVGAALPAFDLKTGQPSIETLPRSDVKTGYEILNREFNAGVLAPVRVVVDADANAPATQQGVQRLIAALARDPDYGPATTQVSPDGKLTVVSVPVAREASTQAAYDKLRMLRGTLVPAAFDAQRRAVYVTGATADNADFNSVMADYSPYVFAFVLGLSFLLLTMAFRSVVVPAKAIAMNLLSVGAAYGLLVAVFQKGYLAGTLGLQRAENIAAWLPIFLFCVLFGLSMDYHVFLLSRIREHFDASHNNDESVAVGLQSTAKIITGAALIMVAVFGAFAAGRLVEIQQMGFGLAAAVFLDATVVRSLLVPAAMKLLGERNWYMPTWLSWLPDLRIEGDTPAPQPAPAYAMAEATGDD